MLSELRAISGIRVRENAPLSQYTRFGIGGAADLFVETGDEAAFQAAWAAIRGRSVPCVVIGGGSNLIVSDAGFRGAVLRYDGARLGIEGGCVHVQAGVVLQDLVDATIAGGLEGLHTMTGIPGWTGGALYGNAGAYGHSIHEFVREVRFCDGAAIRTLDNAGCRFAYRESVFKERKDWIIFSAGLELPRGDAGALRRAADEIRAVRDAKYPPAMMCAGSIFKNLIVRDLPADVASQIPRKVIREGKAPSAWFLEQVNAKGMRRGNIQVAAYHANLIYNDGGGRSDDLAALIAELKARVADRFGFELEEEVQYIGF
ncbi:MAG: UDP-N-acetylmuramate dehydrogenase [Bryobacteraceae bacterium]|nr:UDP-N-acetylmuramate dehydrogenase [Bryobacteraceae bacterium]